MVGLGTDELRNQFRNNQIQTIMLGKSPKNKSNLTVLA
jgi:hypothetical protein